MRKNTKYKVTYLFIFLHQNPLLPALMILQLSLKDLMEFHNYTFWINRQILEKCKKNQMSRIVEYQGSGNDPADSINRDIIEITEWFFKWKVTCSIIQDSNRVKFLKIVLYICYFAQYVKIYHIQTWLFIFKALLGPFKI